MAQVAEADIIVGSMRIVGRVSVDAGALRGVGGPHEPRLVVPVGIEMTQSPPEEMLALVRLGAQLHIGDQIHDPTSTLGQPIALDLIENMPCRSVGAMRHVEALHFPLTRRAMSRLEGARHQRNAGAFSLTLALSAQIAWLATEGEAGKPMTSPVGVKFGLHSRLSYFWTTSISPVRVGIEPSVWIDEVLPGLGLDRLRLVEIQVPPPLPRMPNAAAQFDAALSAYDRQQYNDCIGKCRALLRAWNRQFGATNDKRLAEIVGERMGWDAKDPRLKLLDGVWQGLLDLANAAHHPEDQARHLAATAADARLHLILTASASEYLGSVRPAT
jgi:hypothetical protein